MSNIGNDTSCDKLNSDQLTAPIIATAEEIAELTKQSELRQLTTDLAAALEGLLGQAAVDGADSDEINPQAVFAANAALTAYKRHPQFNYGDCSLPPEASKLNDGTAIQLLGVCVRDLIPLAENEVEAMRQGVSSDPQALGPGLEAAEEKVERARQAICFLNSTELHIEGLPSDHFDDDFEIRFY